MEDSGVCKLCNNVGIIQKDGEVVNCPMCKASAGAAGYKQDAEMTDDVDLQMAQSERDDVIRAAARIANALKDIYNDIGELPEVKARFDLVAADVAHYSGMEDCGL